MLKVFGRRGGGCRRSGDSGGRDGGHGQYRRNRRNADGRRCKLAVGADRLAYRARADFLVGSFSLNRRNPGVGGNDFDRFVEEILKQLPRQGEDKTEKLAPRNQAERNPARKPQGNERDDNYYRLIVLKLFG